MKNSNQEVEVKEKDTKLVTFFKDSTTMILLIVIIVVASSTLLTSPAAPEVVSTPNVVGIENPVEAITMVPSVEPTVPQVIPFKSYSLGVSPETVRASLESFFKLNPQVLVKINLAQKLVDEIATNDLGLLDSLVNGNAEGIRKYGAWFQSSTSAEVQTAREQIRVDYLSAAEQNGFGLGTLTWAHNTALVLESLGYPEDAKNLRDKVSAVVLVQIEQMHQEQESRNSQNVPSAIPKVTPGNVISPDVSNLSLSPEVIEQVVQKPLEKDFEANKMNILSAPVNASGALGIGYSRPQMLYSLKRVYAWTQGIHLAQRLETPYVVGVYYKPVLPFPVYELDQLKDTDPKKLEILNGAFDIYKVTVVVSDTNDIRVMEDWNSWLQVGVWGDVTEGEEMGSDGRTHYWNSITLFWLMYGQDKFPIKTGDILDPGFSLADLIP